MGPVLNSFGPVGPALGSFGPMGPTLNLRASFCFWFPGLAFWALGELLYYQKYLCGPGFGVLTDFTLYRGFKPVFSWFCGVCAG